MKYLWGAIAFYAATMAAVMFVWIFWPVIWFGEIQQSTEPSHLSVRDFLTLSLWLICITTIGFRELKKLFNDD